MKEANKNTESDPFVKQSTLEEIQGYGYQLWQTTHMKDMLCLVCGGTD